MRALTVRQPWAWLVATGRKPIENRSWTTMYRGPLLVVAGCYRMPKDEIQDIRETFRVRIPEEELLYGQAIGIVDLVDVVTEHKSRWFADEGFGWVLKNPRRITPFPVKGRLGLFEVDVGDGARTKAGAVHQEANQGELALS